MKLFTKDEIILGVICTVTAIVTTKILDNISTNNKLVVLRQRLFDKDNQVETMENVDLYYEYKDNVKSLFDMDV